MQTHAASIMAAVGCMASAMGCGQQPSPSATFDSEGWIDVDSVGTPSERPGAGPGEDDDGDEDDEGSGAFWGLFGRYADGQLQELEGEFFAEDGDREVCILVFAAEVRGPARGCADCIAAWEIELGEPQPELDVDGGCQTHAPEQIQGLIMRLGITADDLIMRDQGEGWRAMGEVSFEDGEIVLEWEDDASA